MLYSTSLSTNIQIHFYHKDIIESFLPVIDVVNYQYSDISFSYSLDNVSWSEYFTFNVIANEVVNKEIVYFKCKILARKNNNLEHSKLSISVAINDVLIRGFKAEILQDSNILSRTRDGNLYDPYMLSENAKTLQNIMSKSASDIFGHDVMWFKATHSQENSNATFREYEFAESMQQRTVRIVVKNNYIPDNRTRFAEFDIDFQEELEIHIDKNEWTAVYGEELIPTSDDYFYFPLTEQMYVVNSPYKEKNFMQNKPFWKMVCIKYEKRSSTITNDFVEEEINTLIDFSSDANSQQIADEKNDTLQPTSNLIHQDNNISECGLIFGNVEIFRYYYNFSDNEDSEIAKAYNNISIINNAFTFMGWFKITKNTTTMLSIDGVIEVKVNDDKQLEYKLLVDNIVGSATTTSEVEMNLNEWFAIAISSNSYSTVLSVIDCNMVVLHTVEIEYSLKSVPTKIDLFNNMSFANIRLNKRKLLSTGPLSIKNKLVENIATYKENYIIDNASPELSEPKNILT